MFKNAFFYTLAEIIKKLIPFLLLPLLSKELTVPQFGALSNFNTLSSIVFIFIVMSSSGAFTVNYFKFNDEQRSRYAGNVLLFTIISGALFSLLFFLPWLDGWMMKLELNSIFWLHAVGFSIGQGFINLYSGFSRVTKNGIWILIYQIVFGFVNIGLTYYLFYALEDNLEARIMAISSSHLILGVFAILFIHRKLKINPKFDLEAFKDILKFGVPLIPHLISGWLKSGVDKIFITLYLGTTVLGIYGFGFQISLGAMAFAQALNSSLAPDIYERLSKGIHPSKMRKLIGLFTLVLFAGIVIYYFVIKIGFPILFDVKFIESLDIFGFFLIAYFIKGVYMFISNFIFYKKKNWLISSANIFSSIFYFILIYLFFEFKWVESIYFIPIILVLAEVILLALTLRNVNKLYNVER
jgi:O-antigen/teichoic acid export membrane protein